MVFGYRRQGTDGQAMPAWCSSWPVVFSMVAVLGMAGVTAYIDGSTTAAGAGDRLVLTRSEPVFDRTGVAEAQRVDRVPTPKLDWTGCGAYAPNAQCATVVLPLDYDEPNGVKTNVAVLRIKAADQARKIGTLFVNPGGPGGSGTLFAAQSGTFMGSEVLARFDILGFDPRGTHYSDNVRCWSSTEARSRALAGMAVPFPTTAQQTAAYIKAARALGQACSTTGKPLSGAMSTADVARDMDVLRRAVGDRQLTYFGISYGSFLGQVYANLFPDRVRALAIDAILDPQAVVGTPATRSIPSTVRGKAPEAAARALHELLVRCRNAGSGRCSFAATGDPIANYNAVINTLEQTPLTVTDPSSARSITVTYPLAIAGLWQLLTTPQGVAGIADILTWTSTLQNPAAPVPQRAAANAALFQALTRLQTPSAPPGPAPWPSTTYDNTLDATFSLVCTDGLHPTSADQWPAYADTADTRVPGFGRLAAWADAPCASATWTAAGNNTYRGPFNRRTTSPVLIIGNYWDPSTNYDNAVTVSRHLPNSRLVSVDSWGHTAFTRSTCLDNTLQTYFLTQAIPAPGAHCTGTYQPFATTRHS
jgi:pimeloyl-ACP methyl ester carboxylesterase